MQVKTNRQYSAIGDSVEDAMYTIRSKYGERAVMVSYNVIPKKGFKGLLGYQRYEVIAEIPLNSPSHGSSQRHSTANQAVPDATKVVTSVSNQQSPLQSSDSLSILSRQIHSLGKQLEKVQSNVSSNNNHAEPPELNSLRIILRNNEFTESFIDGIIKKVRGNFVLESLRDVQKLHATVLEWLISDISFSNWKDSCPNPITMLVGPTGIGKTTTIAKIAKICGYGDGKERISTVALLTLDNYRLAAKEQLEGYGRPMDYPVYLITDANDLNITLKNLSVYQHILIDTIGRSPQEGRNLGDMHDIVAEHLPSMNVVLTISATTKYSDIQLILEHYKQFEYRSIIITKIDETRAIGPIISALSGSKIPIIYITTGQRVPLDIVPASKVQFMEKFEGFSLDSSNMQQILLKTGE